jgi:hypothetical protein
LPRSSIIISDDPLHRETNYRTEFVIALNNQPQGGLITRPRTPPETLVAGNDGGFFGGLFRQGGAQSDNTRKGGGRNDQRQNSPFFFR